MASTWSDAEVRRLRVLKASGASDAEVACLMNRSIWSVIAKLRDLREPKRMNVARWGGRKQRRCLRCRRGFDAEPGMFLCAPCKQAPEFSAAM